MADETKTPAKRRPARAKAVSGAVIKDQVAVADVVLDSAVQPREHISTAVINEYADAMRSGKTFPEIVVYRDPETGVMIAADGWHRTLAAKEADKATIAAEIREGTKRDAILYSVSANATHGLQRTNADKRRAVFRLLEDDEWSQWSDSVIAEKADVSQPFVSDLRRRQQAEDGESVAPRARRTADGRDMDTTKIGKKRGAKADEQAPTPVAAEENGHAPVRLVPDPDEDMAPGTATSASALTVESFAQRFVEMMLLIETQPFDPEDVFNALDNETLNALADKWDDVIGKFDGYSDALEKVLEGAPA